MNYLISREPDSDYIEHYGVLGMKWGRRKANYKSTGLKSAIARRANDKVDKSFKKWNENSKKKNNAIELGKKCNETKIAYEKNKSDKNLKSQYKQYSKAYKRALHKNTTYRKGQIKQEVGSNISRKYLSEAKKIRKQLEKDPNNKTLQRQYNKLMSKHDIERANARRAPKVAAMRSSMKSSIKRSMTMTVKTLATTTAIAGGVYATNKYMKNHQVTLNGKPVRFSSQNVKDVANLAKKVHKFMDYVY